MNKQKTKQKYQKTGIQTYRIAFGGDDCLYSVSFKAAMKRMELNRLLTAARSSRYENIPKTILRCLDSSRLEYSDFLSGTARLNHETVMSFADCLVHGSSCGILGRLAKGADVYCGIMDHQCQIDGNCFEGCYYAVSRTVSRQNNTAQCHVICQTFQCDLYSGRETSFFAIKRNRGSHCMYTLEEASGYPVLSPFGCVDMAGLLADIPSITTKEQAARIANCETP